MARNSTNARLAITRASLAFPLALPIRGVRNAASSGMAIIRIGE